MSFFEVLESELRTFEIDLPTTQKQLLARYCDELVHWNKRINLTALIGSELVRRLVIEPAWIALQLQPQGILADIGSGNGSPAVPLHVICNFRKVNLIEARAKRAAFLRHLTTTLPLPDVVIHRARFDEVAPKLRRVDWITLQGVALTSELLGSMKQIASETTNIVWITSAAVPLPLNPVRTLLVPLTGTEVFLFRLTR